MNRLISALLLLNIVSVSLPAYADNVSKTRELVDNATASVKNFTSDPDMTYLRRNLGAAEGLLIIPSMVKGAFIVGGSGGSGVLLAKGKNKQWSSPAFYTMGSGSIGFQWGGEVSEIILMVMTQNGMDHLMSSSFKLGADASVAAGPTGVGSKAQTADILAYSRTKGVYAGFSLEGAVVSVRPEYNTAYYGKAVRPLEILATRSVSSPHADKLRQSVADMIADANKQSSQ